MSCIRIVFKSCNVALHLKIAYSRKYNSLAGDNDYIVLTKLTGTSNYVELITNQWLLEDDNKR